MMGSTHKAVGVFTGIVLSICGVLYEKEMWVMALSTVSFGAILPDIDHNNSKLGRSRKKAIDLSKKVIVFSSIAAIIVCLILVFMVGKVDLLLKALSIPSCILLLYYISNNKNLKQRFKFFTKHRGIMHTSIVPILSSLAGFTIDNEALRYLLLGLAIGYTTHLLGDCMTKGGCPILYPITQKNISFLRVTTNTFGEKVAAVILCIGITGVCVLCFKLTA